MDVAPIFEPRAHGPLRRPRGEVVAPLWEGWPEGWIDWPYSGRGAFGGAYAWPHFANRYTGKVFANLESDAGGRMRCRLRLAPPTRGMAGGGDGECQLSEGGTIHARFR